MNIQRYVSTKNFTLNSNEVSFPLQDRDIIAGMIITEEKSKKRVREESEEKTSKIGASNFSSEEINERTTNLFTHSTDVSREDLYLFPEVHALFHGNPDFFPEPLPLIPMEVAELIFKKLQRKKTSDFFPEPLPCIPLEIVERIFEKLKVEEIARLQEVSQTWRQFIQTHRGFFTRLTAASCLAEAKKSFITATLGRWREFDETDIYQIFERLLKIEGKYDIEAAKKTVIIAKTVALHFNNQEEQSNLLAAIAKVEARYYREAANQTLAAITPHLREWENFGLRLYIAQKIERNIPAARAIMLEEPFACSQGLIDIVKQLAQKDMDAAQKSLLAIENIEVRDEACIAIVKGQIQNNVVEARRTASQITDLRYRCLAELVLAQFATPHDYNPAIQSALIIENEVDRDRALVQIARVQIHYDAKGAEDTINLIKEDGYKFKLLEIKAVFDYRIAVSVLTSSTEDDFGKESFKWTFLLHLAETDIRLAKIMALSFDYFKTRTMALLELGKLAYKPLRSNFFEHYVSKQEIDWSDW